MEPGSGGGSGGGVGTRGGAGGAHLHVTAAQVSLFLLARRRLDLLHCAVNCVFLNKNQRIILQIPMQCGYMH